MVNELVAENLNSATNSIVYHRRSVGCLKSLAKLNSRYRTNYLTQVSLFFNRPCEWSTQLWNDLQRMNHQKWRWRIFDCRTSHEQILIVFRLFSPRLSQTFIKRSKRYKSYILWFMIRNLSVRPLLRKIIIHILRLFDFLDRQIIAKEEILDTSDSP